MKQEKTFAPYLAADDMQQGFQLKHLDKNTGRHWLPYHDQYVFLLISKGAAVYESRQLSGQLTLNQLMFTRPGELQQVSLDQNAKGVAICFGRIELDEALRTDTLFQQLLEFLISQKKAIPVKANALTAVRQTLDLLDAAAAGPADHRIAIQFAYLKILLLQAIELPKPDVIAQPLNRNQRLVSQFFRLLDDHYKKLKMVVEYADKLSVTPNYLNEVIKKETGQPAGQHIRSRVVREAKMQASQPDLGMKAIAYDLGFLDMAHFSKFFKNTTGLNFSDYKKMDRVALAN